MTAWRAGVFLGRDHQEQGGLAGRAAALGDAAERAVS
jgi:hypothetical protein